MKPLKIEPLAQPGRILQYWKDEKPVVLTIILFGLGFNGTSLLSPIWQGKLIDSLLRGDSLPAVLELAAAFLLLVGGIQLARCFKRYYIRLFANRTSAKMRLMIFNNIMHKSYAELELERAGDLITRAMSDVELCVEGMRKFTTEIFDTGVLMAAYFIAMLFYDWKITLLAGVFTPVAMLIAEKMKTLIYRYSIACRTKSSDIADMTCDAIDNALLYRANGLEAQNRDRYRRELGDLQDKAVKANILENSMQPLYNLIAMGGVILVIYLGGQKVIGGGWTVGTFSAYLTMFAALALKASKAAKLFNSVQKSQVSWRRVKPYLTEHQTLDRALRIERPHTRLEIENLEFSFPAARDRAIAGISLTGQDGEIIGITGPIASGKSALGQALLGLCPYQGSIRIDGRELRDYSDFERSSLIAYLGHKSQLLSDTIYNNITLGEPQDISAVLRDVCFEEDLAAMPAGAKTLVGNSGVRLSGGQQARIALARTLLRPSKIIFLDDPFASVDRLTEEKIIASLKSHYRDRLIILASHRLAIFPQVDRIVLLQAGQILQAGSHEELMRQSELYRTIFNLQGQAEETEDE